VAAGADNSRSLSVQEKPHHAHVVQPASLYVWTYVILLAFLVLTVGASFVPVFHGHSSLAILAIPIALAIAVIKMLYVIMNFMGVRFSTKLTWIWAFIGFVFLILMFTIVTDTITRGWMHISGWTQ
jgi:cytochrome c oxidase subunit 4